MIGKVSSPVGSLYDDWKNCFNCCTLAYPGKQNRFGSLSNNSDSEGKSETVDPENNLDEYSERKSVGDISNSLFSSSSDPASVSDLDDC